ncbi:ABC transporter G family member 15 [Acrodontium crateriforme]|uniref:ABC transporter G family member 15 n=1 Tax=Acrodontium crateriforme TaxID=150365 RepID=A0AAQ3LY64_9PEZI|nr:ABC transporter G family member 15 [Acrodontium crateriforme]
MRPSQSADGVELLNIKPREMETLSPDVETQADRKPEFKNVDIENLSWRNLTVTVTDRKTKQQRNILSSVSGIAYPGEVIALMGPSGSGKTTLLNALAQRHVANPSGKVLINGKKGSLETHRTISSFVEQEDTLIGSLTVEETLNFAASLALPRSISRIEKRARVSRLIKAFGLEDQRHTIIGTPIQKGISGGQKRRVSVAAQMITEPRVLYLDEPTSGLDATASFEVMSLICKIAREQNLIVIASIHQPSTKTFNLFSKILLLSQGKTCYFGKIPGLHAFLADLNMPVPKHTNPAEYILDLTNTDFQQMDEGPSLEYIHVSWQESPHAQQIIDDISTLRGPDLLSTKAIMPPGVISQTITLLHRSWIKALRDLFVYWIRVAMYLGLAVMMGTVWLRLSPVQGNIQSFINAIFFGSAFMSFMAVAYVPAFLEDRAVFVKERSNGLCSPTAFLLANFLMGLPFLFLISVLFSVISYWLINFEPTAKSFLVWIMWLFLDLIAAESLVVLISSLMPNFVVALALTAFANGLWMCVGGFLVSIPELNVFWRYVFHYIDYQAYVFQGMMVNEFKARTYDCATSQDGGSCYCMYPSSSQDSCRIDGTSVLDRYGYAKGKEGQWIAILIGIIVVYRFLGWTVTWFRKT